ncbi:UTP--glucose-1-phosphate uridylyltransferase GalU [Canibacter sp. lx-72]|uniref:UTP--glucose-1-phosphate uridylyltransferase GalU n=1 Tax=Canibacter zhuwentaonis TaxID=2837491 RepID=UPI001BDC90E3|nr:UTP--glucose-1-phosphate uridylyltransferase GalU [Canibacter zhuwentaonis]MBT1018367.1 UTP--glucose-1-phosphate uridylyltransferase GalU [Canibacter zhuwentaonis]MBT1035556.1 UTP--glucose-1-phosphate uridylyltransferase GalU [Canibacter zhuwentaonis]
MTKNETLNSGVTKAVIPAAGLGTRFLPATKATPKEMLPIVDKPAIQYVVEEASASGLQDVLVIIGRNKGNIVDHFDSVPELEIALEKKDDANKLERVRAVSEIADVHMLRQGQPLGLGHAVLCARQHVGDSSFAVLLGDDLIDERDPLLPQMIAEHDKRQATVIALMEVPEESIHLYGCADVETTEDPSVVRVKSLVEKPDAASAPSNLAVIGRYVLRPEIFELLEKQGPGRGGEIQLTDALNTLAESDSDSVGPVYGVLFKGRRYDTGDKADWIKANLRLGVENEDFGAELKDWIRDFASNLES